jgi:Uma2 family endonuclease
MSSVTSALPNSGMPQAASTVAPSSLAVCTPAEKRIAIRGLSWELYDALSDAIDQKQRVFLAYDGTDLEIMVKGREHDHYKDLVGQLVHVIADDLRIPHRGAGETTWKRIELLRGVEADQCYLFATEKLARDAAALKRRSRNIDDYPNPDLAIEIDMSPPQIDRDAIYAVLHVPELWRFDGETVVIVQLGPDGVYSPTEASEFLLIRADEIRHWLLEEDTDDFVAWRDRLRTWIQSVLAPRLRP